MGGATPEDASGSGQGAVSAATETSATVDERGALRSTAPSSYDADARIARYIIREQIAEGGMGVIYRAHDPELDRDVALKVLRVASRSATGTSRSRARLLREAQALAQLSHPNVVVAHDVVVTADDVVVAMELVDGVTLREWLRSGERSLSQRLEVLVAAGRGLAAAHAAGLVHRDFKPSNVLVGSDGRVRVADFGLARVADPSDEAERAFEDGRDRGPHDGGDESFATTSDERLSARLTAAGTVLGTPGYMSPEQYAGGVLDAQTDQFSFCVTLYEAVYGERPFRARHPAALKEQVETGAFSPPAEPRVPGWLRRVIERGLAVDPADRFPSMDALLRELSRDRRGRRRSLLLVAGAALVAGGSATFAIVSSGAEPALCRDVGDRVHEVWTDETRARLHEVFSASDRTYASATAKQVSALIDRYADDWSRMRVEACRATRVGGDQSEQVLDLRIRCLDRGLGALRAQLDELMDDPDAAVVDRAVRAALELPPVRHCADIERLGAEYPPPEDPARSAAIDAQYAVLDRATALYAAGRYEAGLAAATKVVNASESTNYAPLRARALLRQGRLQVNLGRRDEALESFREASAVAGHARADALLAEAMIEIYYLTGPLAGRYAEAAAIGPFVDAVVARAGDRPEHRADALAIRGYITLRSGDAVSSVEMLSVARELFVAAYGRDHPHVAHALNYLSMAYNELGRFEESSDALAGSIGINEQLFGPDHPMLIAPLNNLGTLLLLRGSHDEGLQAIDRALAIARSALPADHPKIGVALATRAEILIDAGRCDDALPALQESLKLFEDKLGPEHENVGYPLTGIGRCYVEAGRAAQALPVLERAESLRTVLPPADPERARTSFWIARAMWQLRQDRTAAIARATEVRDVLAAAGPAYARFARAVAAWIAQPK